MVRKLTLACLLAIPAMAETLVMGNVTNAVWTWDGTRFVASWGSPIAWSPLSLAGCSLWLDANDSSTLYADATTLADVGDYVTIVTDKSPDNRTIKTRAGSASPIKMLMSGNNVLGFNGAMLEYSGMPINAEGTVLYAAGRSGAAEDYQYVFGIGNLNETPEIRMLVNWAAVYSGTYYLHPYYHGMYGENLANKMYINACRIGVGIDWSQNGAVFFASELGPVPAFAAAQLRTIGGYLHTGGTEKLYLTGAIAELICYSRKLSDTELTQATNYLHAKWAHVVIAEIPAPPTPTYTISFDSQGGSIPSPSSISGVVAGTYYDQIPGLPADPTMEGMTFGGWFSYNWGDNVLPNSWSYYAVSGDETLYAQWY